MDFRLFSAILSVSLFAVQIGGAAIEEEDGLATMAPTRFPPTETNVSLIRFYLWTRDNQVEEEYDELFVGDGESILNSHFDGGKKTKVLAHGFTSSGLTSFVGNAREAYLEKGENAILWCLILTVFVRQSQPMARFQYFMSEVGNHARYAATRSK